MPYKSLAARRKYHREYMRKQRRKGLTTRVSQKVSQTTQKQSEKQATNVKPREFKEGLIVGPDGCLPEPKGWCLEKEKITKPETKSSDGLDLNVDAWVQRKMAEIDE